MSLAVLVVLAAAVGAVAATGAVGAQEAGNNTTNASSGDDGFYSPSEEEPLNVRLRDCCGNTVESVADGVLNLNVVYALFDGPYDVNISAPGLSDDQVDDIVFDETDNDVSDLERTDIVGLDFGGVPAGEYNLTVSVDGGDAERTVPLEVTGEGGAADEATNETAANESAADETATNETETNETAANETTETEDNETGPAGGAGNASVVADPATAGNSSAFHNVSVVAGSEAAGNLSEVTVNYGDSNASIGLVGGNIASVTLNDEQVVNNSTLPTVGADGRNLTIGFDGTLTVEEGDRIAMNYTGVTNPNESGEYTVGVAVNNESFQNTTLAIGGGAAGANNTTGEDTAGTNNTTAGPTGETGNASIVADPATAGNASAFHNVSVVAGSEAAGNLSEVTVNYGDSNASIGLVGGNIASVTLNDEQVVNNSTLPTVGADGRNLTIGFDGTLTVEEGDRITMNYTGVTNPNESGEYTVGVAVNNESFQNTTLAITGSSAAGGTNATTGTTGTTMTGGTTSGETASTAGTTAETTTGGATETDGGAETSGDTATSGGAGTSGEANGSGGQQGTDAGGPGFGIAIAVVALLAAALLAVRRN